MARETIQRLPISAQNEPTPRSADAQDLIRRAPMGYVWNQISSLWMFAASFLFTIVLTRMLSNTRYGDMASALTIYNTALYLAAFGLEDASTVFVPRILAERGRAAAGSIVRRTLITRVIGVAIICSGLVWGIPALANILTVLHLPLGKTLTGALRVPGLDALALPVAAYIAGTGIFNQLSAVFTAILRTRTTLVIGGLAQLGNLLVAYIVLHAGYDINAVLWAVAGVTWVGALVYLILLAPFWLPAPIVGGIPDFVPVLQMGSTAWVTNLVSGALLKQVAFSLLQAFTIGSAAIASFNLAFQLTHAAAFLLIAGLGGVGMAAMSAAYSGDNRRDLGFAWRAVSKVQILLAVPLLTFTFIYARQIAITLYTAKYTDVGPLMQLFLVFNILQRVCGGGSHQAALYVIGRQTLALWTQVGGLVLTVVVGIILIPMHGPLGGAAGALVAVGISQVLVEIIQLILAAFYLKRSYPIRFSGRVLLALIPATVLTWFFHPSAWIRLPSSFGPIHISVTFVELVVAVTVFAAILIAGLAVVKPVDREDVDVLAQFNPRLRPVLSLFATKE